MTALVEFVGSDQGRLFGKVCERWGVDPGSFLEDDVLGFNLRLGLGLADRGEPEPEPTTADEGWERAGDALRREVYG